MIHQPLTNAKKATSFKPADRRSSCVGQKRGSFWLPLSFAVLSHCFLRESSVSILAGATTPAEKDDEPTTEELFSEETPFNDFNISKVINLSVSVMTRTPPLAYRNHTKNVDRNEQPSAVPEDYQGFQLDLLRLVQQIAFEYDQIQLNLMVQEVSRPFDYHGEFNRIARDCNTSFIPIDAKYCHHVDMIVADYYYRPNRVLHIDFTQSFISTAAAAVTNANRSGRSITTLDEAQALNATVCLLDFSFYDLFVMEKWPDGQYIVCYSHDECIDWLKQDSCALFVEDELQLRHRAVQDPDLLLTKETFQRIQIAWPMDLKLDPTVRSFIKRWIAFAQEEGMVKGLYDQYFSVSFCPLGWAGENCDQPCSAANGMANREGKCVCDSTKWTGDDCNEEVKENMNLIPGWLRLTSYMMVTITVVAVLLCALWLFWKRSTAQVQVSQPLFLGLVLLGCLISTSTVVAMAQEAEYGDVPACATIPWLYSIGFSITFGSLFAKIRRAYQLFCAAADMRRETITWKETLSIVGWIILADSIILIIWTTLDPLTWVRKVETSDKYGNPLESYGYCSSEEWELYAGIIAAFHLLLIGTACYMCYVARQIPTAFSEGKYVAIAMVSNLQIFVVGVPVLLILGNDPGTSFFVRSVVVWMNDFVVIALIMGNLIYSVHFGPNAEKQDLIRSSVVSFVQSRARASEHCSTLSLSAQLSRQNTDPATCTPDDNRVDLG